MKRGRVLGLVCLLGIVFDVRAYWYLFWTPFEELERSVRESPGGVGSRSHKAMKLLGLMFALCLALPVLRAVDFKNLGFDDGIAPVGETIGGVAELLPGWEVIRDGVVREGIDYNILPDFTPFFAVVDGTVFPWREGRFCVAFTRGNTNEISYTLRQTGDIPAEARFLAVRAYGGELMVSLDGESVPLVAGEAHGFVTNRVFDVSQFAGKTAVLELSGPTGTADAIGRIQSYLFIDSLRFVSAPPLLSISLDDKGSLKWPLSAESYAVEAILDLRSNSWQHVDAPAQIVGTNWEVRLPQSTPMAYFRLGLMCNQCGF